MLCWAEAGQNRSRGAGDDPQCGNLSGARLAGEGRDGMAWVEPVGMRGVGDTFGRQFSSDTHNDV